LSVQSRPHPRIEFSMQGMYSSGSTSLLTENENFLGLLFLGKERQLTLNNTASPHRIIASADGGVTVHLFERLRFTDTFSWMALRSPGLAHTVSSTLFGPNMLIAPNAFTPATCPAPFTAPTCPQHSGGSS